MTEEEFAALIEIDNEIDVEDLRKIENGQELPSIPSIPSIPKLFKILTKTVLSIDKLFDSMRKILEETN